MSKLSTIDSQIPQSLDNIIRANRDKFSLRMGTAEDYAALPPMVASLDNQSQVRATINDWRIVCLAHNGGSVNSLMLTGMHKEQNCVWCTSSIASIDFENNLVQTNNSLYRLGSKGEGETDLYINLHLCYCLRSWGLGEVLGVPYVFY